MEKHRIEIYEKLPYLIIKSLIEKTQKNLLKNLTLQKEDQDEIMVAKAMISEIEKILDSGRCICGNKIGEIERRVLIEKKKKYKEKLKDTDEVSLTKLIEKHQKLNEMLQMINRVEIEYKDMLKRRDEILFEMDEISSQIKSINKKLSDTLNEENYDELKGKYDAINLQIAKLTQDIKWAEERYNALKKEEEKTQNQMLEMKIKSPKIERLNKKISLVSSSLEALNEYLNRFINLKKKNIEEEATKVFRELTNKKGVFEKVVINDDYVLSIVDKDGEIVDNDSISAGEKQILALSFIAGLRKSTNKEAPVIMDTPFGRLDHEHKMNVMKFLHRLGDQIVILATDEDISKDNIDTIAPYIGKQYEIKFLPDKKSSIIKEVV